MSFEEYLALPDDVRAEYVDGVAIVSPPPTRGHNKVARRVAQAIERALPELDVSTEAGWRRPGRDRIPDVAVFAEFKDVSFDEATPILVVEVVSPSSRTEDTLRKPDDYREGGVGQYWIVDRTLRTLVVLDNRGSRWNAVLELDETRPTGSVRVGRYGEVELDLEQLLGP